MQIQHITRITTIFTLLLAIHASLHAAELRTSSLFSNNMVLQRGQALPVWGSADPGETVAVAFAGQRKTAKADADGKWVVTLDALEASSEGRELIVESNQAPRKSIINNVVVGDVWLCSGQSNMHFQLKSTENAAQEISAANNSSVRFFTVKHQFAQTPMDKTAGEWQTISPTTAAACSAVAYYFAINLQKSLNVPIGLLVSSVGGTRIESWMRSETLAATGESRPLVEKWKGVSAEEFKKIETAYSAFQDERDRLHPQAVKEAKAKNKPLPPAPQAPKQRCHDCPSSLHNGMIAPLQPFAICGAIWYQGESNAGQSAPYEKMLPAMIADWRQVWGKEMPFLFVQLAPHRSIHPSFREAQHRIWKNTPHTAMAVTTDVGNMENIHPTRKSPVGERLALAARALVYNEPIEYSGPLFEKMNIDQKRVVLFFTHVGEGLMAKEGALKGFTVAGADGKFLPAQAIIEGDTVTVSSDKIAKPTAVRYGWGFMPGGNLFNHDGLPAAPFRTDQPVAEN